MGNYHREEYHATRTPWRNRFNKTGPYVGVELEVEAIGGTSYRHLLNLLPDVKSNNHRPLTEEDGSLSDRGGLEIVFPPVKASTLLRANSVFGKFQRALAGNVRYHRYTGMHLNVNTRGWLPVHVDRFMLVVHTLPQTMLENLGGRNLNSYCRQWFYYSLTGMMMDIRQYENCWVGEHSYAAERRNGRIELRFPRATTSPKRMRALLTFIDTLTAYATTATAQGITYKEYVDNYLALLATSGKGRNLLKVMNEGLTE